MGCSMALMAGMLMGILMAMLAGVHHLSKIRTELMEARLELVRLRTETVQTRTEVMSLHATLLLDLNGSCSGFSGQPGAQLKIGDRVVCYVDESGNVRRNAP
jgi:hypothetical protein